MSQGGVAVPVDLLSLDDERFRSIVDSAVRGNVSKETMAQLKTPEVANRCYMALVTMKKNVEGQLAAKRADYNRQRVQFRKNPNKLREAEERWLTWRGGALRFKTGVEELMVEIRGKRSPSDWALRAERNEVVIAYENLRQAIAAHRDHVCTAECDEKECVADVTLWSVLDD